MANIPARRKFDLVIANPPYIPTADIPTLEPDVRDHEPLLALDGGPDGLAVHRQIADQAGAVLKTGGMIQWSSASTNPLLSGEFTRCGFGPFIFIRLEREGPLPFSNSHKLI